MKKILSVLAAFILLFTLASCGKSIEKSIIGKWYNDDKRCLEIQKDGSYVLENQYGKGKWQVLDDKTIEFVDFYGERDTADFIKIDGEICIDFGYYGKFYQKQKDKTEKETSQKETKQDSVKEKLIKEANNFSDGVAWVKYGDAVGEKTLALINTKGKILYKTDILDGYSVEAISNKGINCYILNEESTRKKTYYLFDNQGKSIADSNSGLFDSVLAVDNGQALVYKNTSDISEESYTIGVIGIDGKYVSNAQKFDGDYGYKDTSVKYTIANSFYSGSNVWSVKINRDYFNINMSNGKSIVFDKPLKFYNGVAYSCGGGKVIKFDTNFNTTEIPNVTGDGLDGCTLFKYEMDDDVVKKVIATNLSNNKSINIESYGSDRYSLGLYCIDNYIVETIQGKDSKNYFTVIDKTGKKLFEPVVGEYSSLSENILVYESENVYRIIDLSDNTKAELFDMTDVGEFRDGLACAKENGSENKFYINKKGEKVISSISE